MALVDDIVAGMQRKAVVPKQGRARRIEPMGKVQSLSKGKRVVAKPEAKLRPVRGYVPLVKLTW